MNRVRIERRRPGYVQIDNAVIRDCRISLRARGALGYLLSQPDEFDLDVGRWAKENKRLEAAYGDGKADPREGRAAIYKALDELKAAGYLERRRIKLANGHFGWETVLHEIPPTVPPLSKNQEVEPTRENIEETQVTPLTKKRYTANLQSIEDSFKKNKKTTADPDFVLSLNKYLNRFLESNASKDHSLARKVYAEMALVVNEEEIDQCVGEILLRDEIPRPNYVLAIMKSKAKQQWGIYDWEYTLAKNKRTKELQEVGRQKAARWNEKWGIKEA